MPDNTLAARRLLDAAMDRTSIKLEPAMVSNSIETTKIYARTSRGLCFSFRVGSKPEVSGMVSIPLADPGLSDARLFLASRRGRVLPVAAAAFAEQLSSVFEEL
jgi:DNA-binding transcriptional LysR family regulator